MLWFVLLLCTLVSTTFQASLTASPKNVSSVLDSINKDLEEIRQALEVASSKSRLRSKASAAVNELFSSPTLNTEYLEFGDLVKDKSFVVCSKPTDSDSIYKYSIPHLNESLGTIDFNNFRGKPILIVNVATFCESTIEYPLYNQLKDKFGDKVEIVAFPSNQFWNQEPTGDATEVYNAIKYVRPGNGFIPKFPLTKRIDVNGKNQHEIYEFLKRSCPSTRNRFSDNEQYLLWKPKNARDIRWNFEKFLIEPKTGTVWKRYDQKYLPDRIIPDIEKLLAENATAQA